jgi:acetolactate synthase-1/2/3 large subunit
MGDDITTGSALLVECLAAEGVTLVTGLPGTTVMDVLDALYGHPSIRFVSVRHEQVAAGMADGFARATGEVGVCLGSRGPGLTNMATSLATCHDESIPVVALVGQVAHDIAGRGAFEELDVAAMFGAISKQVVQVPSADRIPELVQHAFRTAASGRPGPVVVALPLDVLKASTSARPQRRFRPALPAPDPAAVTAAVALLEPARRPVIVAGGGWRAPADGLLRLAQRLGAPVVTTWLRKDRLPAGHPHALGTLGAGAFPVTEALVRQADVMLALGCRFSEFTTKRWTLVDPATRIVHVDVDPRELGHVHVPEIGIQADAAATVAALLDALPTDPALPALSAARADRVRALREGFDAVRALQLDPRSPTGTVSMPELTSGLAAALRQRPSTLVMDAPSTGVWVQRHLDIERTGSYFASSGGAMGWGLPAAMGIALARPAERVLCVSGDGSFWMVAQDFETCVRERLPVVNVVSNNFSFGNTRDRQRLAHGGRYLGVFYDNVDLAEFARLHGAHGERVTDPEQVGPAIVRAIDSGLPAVVDVVQDRHAGLPPDLEPLPAL